MKKYILKIYLEGKRFSIGKLIVNSESQLDNLLDAINKTDDKICRIDSLVFNKDYLKRIKMKVKSLNDVRDKNVRKNRDKI